MICARTHVHPSICGVHTSSTPLPTGHGSPDAQTVVARPSTGNTWALRVPVASRDCGVLCLSHIHLGVLVAFAQVGGVMCECPLCGARIRLCWAIRWR